MLPSGWNREELDKALTTLTDDGYVQVKYADYAEYCLGLTPQGRSLVADVRVERERRAQATADAAEAMRDCMAALQELKTQREALAQERETLRAAMRQERERMQNGGDVPAQVDADTAQSAADESALDTAESEPTDGTESTSADGAQGADSAVKPSVSLRTAPAAKGKQGFVGHWGKVALLVWLAAFFGALLGGGIVGLVIYLIYTFAL